MAVKVTSVMMSQLLNLFLQLLFVLSLICVSISYHGAFAKPADNPKSMSDVVTSSGLYSSADKVVILNVTTFGKTVMGTDQAWLVEFYNSWCGHCIYYAPIWKTFAADVYGWKSVVRIAVVDCVSEANTPLCRDYEIMRYPTIRFFSAQYQKGEGNFGSDISKGSDAKAMRQLLVEQLEREQLEGRGAHWPNITPYRSTDLHNLWKDVPESVRYSILVFKDKKQEVGTDLVLDLSGIPEVQARTVSPENEAFAKLMQVTTFPAVVAISRGQQQGESIYSQDKSREGFLVMIKSFLKQKNIKIPDLLDEEENEKKDDPNSDKTENTDLQKQVKELLAGKDVAFLGDLEHAIRYSLRHEISLRKHMTGPVLRALRNYLRILNSFFPASNNLGQLLQNMTLQVENLKELSGESWKSRLGQAEASLEGAPWSERQEYLGCRGSRPNFRGYPCSLWTTFHTLTVRAMDSPGNSQPRDVLEAILEYVIHFFGCAECSKHFQEMAAETMFSEVITHQDAAHWLWDAHNKVNARLSGDASEDPEFPKIQFPSIDRCPACRIGNSWDKPQVLQYLRSIYSRGSLSTIGAVGSDAGSSIRAQPLSGGSDMSTLDMSLYVSLCVISVVIIALVFLKFFLPRMYHRKASPYLCCKV